VTAAAPAAPALESPSIKRQALLSLGLALAVGTAILLLPALEPVRDRFAGTNGFWVAAALGLQVLSTLSFVVAFRGAFERRIGWRAAFDLSMVEEGTNVILPSGGSGGLAVGAVLLIRAGVPTRFAVSRSGVLFLATSAVSLLALFIAGTAEAIGLLPGDASLAITLGPALGAALVMVGAVVLSHRIPEIAAQPDQRLRSLVRRAQRFIREAVEISIAMIRGGDALLIGGSVGYFAFDVAVRARLCPRTRRRNHPDPGQRRGRTGRRLHALRQPAQPRGRRDPRLPHLPRRGADDPGDRRPGRHPQAAPGGPRPGGDREELRRRR
jgi:hypothetical protein